MDRESSSADPPQSSPTGTAEPQEAPIILTEKPPKTILGILARLGPGLIIAGSIVGSGELIATTRTGAEAGFWLLWLVIIGCVIKVFVQIEFGRFSIINGQTTMDGLAQVPGPYIRKRGNWIVWFWFLMFLASLGQLGGIVGGVGQALAISVPVTTVGKQANTYSELTTRLQVKQAELALARQRLERGASSPEEIEQLQQQRQSIANLVANTSKPESSPKDQFIWAAIITAVTSAVLIFGRYGLIQSFSTALVALFTMITIVNVLMLQANPTWSITWSEVQQGLSFKLPPAGVATALFTFGIIGVGASELVTYPYWCLEKGYARFTGPRDKSPEWADRARGWMRVMHWDAWCSMVVYTFATIAFYLLGAAILGRADLLPQKDEMVRTLAVMYDPVFGAYAPSLFLFGAFAVLYSTFFVANASQARVFSDVLRVLGFTAVTEESYRGRVRFFSGLLPWVCLVMYIFVQEPVGLVLLSGLMQAIMLPMLAAAALFFRYRRMDERIRPSRGWDLFLILSAIGMLITGTWALWSKILEVWSAIPSA